MDSQLEPMFWCNDDGFGWIGWGSLQSATIFDEGVSSLPIGVGVYLMPLADARKLWKLWDKFTEGLG